MVRGCAIFSQLLLLYVVRDTWGLRCYVGVLGQPQSRTALGKICGVIFNLPCRGVGYYDQFNANVTRSLCTKTPHTFACYCFTDLCNMNISAFREIWKSSPEYTTRGSYHRCFRQNFTDKFVTQPGDDTDTETTVINTEESTSEKAQTTPFDHLRKDMKRSDRTKSSSNGDFNFDLFIFLILAIVAVILLIAIIPALILCIVIKSKRSRSRTPRNEGGESQKSLRTDRSKKSEESAKTSSTKSTNTRSSTKSHGNNRPESANKNTCNTKSRSNR
ncbi:hypothetical protein RB195_016078 [Necator americanus]|uniref:Uncharacterized protein n=1 Tax=Necator americanus TaxID=51031 RepID=A0ABR1E7Q6_NECAM